MQAKIPFLVGVTGHMDIDDRDVDSLGKRIRQMITWLRSPLPEDHGDWDRIDPTGKMAFPSAGLGLGETPIVILSALAPGADSIFARIALEEGLEVKAPLPFPVELYRQATTFHPEGASSVQEEEWLREFDELVKRIPEENLFPIRMREDWALNEEDYYNRCREDLEKPENRRRRYRAAGEYVATYSHLLVSVADRESDNGSRVGVSGIERARLEGFDDRLLQSTSSLNWADCGELLRLPITRGRRRAEGVAPVREGAELFLPAGLVEENGERKEAKCLHLARMSREMEAFNAMPWKGGAELLSGFLRQEPETLALSDEGAGFLQRMTPLIAVRSKAAGLARAYDAERQKVVRSFATLAFVAAILLHLSAHWHIDHESHDAASGSGGHVSARGVSAAPEEDCGEVEGVETVRGIPVFAFHSPWFRLVFLALALTCAAVISVSFGRYRDSEMEPRRFDYRSLAEGLRVQIFWAMAGLPDSAALNYLHRQKRELDWIRLALCSLTLPFNRWKEHFRALPLADQVKLLGVTREGWVAGQRDFYETGSHRSEGMLHRAHHLGWGLTFGGIIMAIAAALVSLSEGIWGIESPRHADSSRVVLAAGFILGAFGWGLQGIAELHRRRSRPRPAWLDRIFRRRVWVLAFSYSGGAIVLAFFLAWIGESRLHGGLPGVLDWWIVLMGTLLVLGAILIAWSEKQSYAEHARQYEGMHHFFANADHRLTRLLEDAGKESEEAEEAIDRAQKILRELGVEALAENAEWLVLHRVRPTEPFTIG